MNGEAAVVNLFLMIRVLVVGALFIFLPRIGRKGLLFGVYVGEEVVEKDELHKILRRWAFYCLILMVLALVVGLAISVAGWPVPGNFTGTGVLLLGGAVLYVRFHYTTRELAPPSVAARAAVSVAVLDGAEPKGVGFARLTLLICSVAGVATFVYAMVRQGAITDHSFADVMWGPSFNLALSPFLALYALLTATAKRSVRAGAGGRSLEAQEAFRTTCTRSFTWMALLFCGIMTFLSVQIIRFRLAEIESPGIPILVGSLVVVVVFAVILFRLMVRFGQGGAHLESGGADAPLTNGLANNTRWVWGLFYVDKQDPSILVESRIGLGYTFNYGNPVALAIVGGFVVLSLGLTALLLVGTFA